MSRDYNNLIEKYFTLGLNESESKIFDDLIENEIAFKQEFEKYKTTIDIIQTEGRKHLKLKLSSLDNTNKNTKNRILNIGLVSLIAIIILILLYTIFYIEEETKDSEVDYADKLENNTEIKLDTFSISNNPKDEIIIKKTKDKESDQSNKNKESVFAATYKPLRHQSFEPLYRGNAKLSNRDQFLSLYWNENYVVALKQYEELTEAEKMNPNLRFQYAICLIESNKYIDAEIVLELLKAENKSRFINEIEWYLQLLKKRND